MNFRIRKIFDVFFDKNLRFEFLIKKGFTKWIPDKIFLKIRFKRKMGYKLDLDSPQSFNEKLQWLKLYDHQSRYIKMVDKYEAKKYVAEEIGSQYIIPTLGLWSSFDKIDFSTLPNEFVIKCTHDSGGIVICKDKAKFDAEKTRRKITQCLKKNYYWFGREWPYKDVKPRVLVEKLMIDESDADLKDYKIFNFWGQPRMIQVDYDRFTNHRRNLYSVDWEYIDASIQYPTDPNIKIPKPVCLEEMLKLAKILSKDIPFVRTDFYCIDNRVYFGELTFYHGSGFEDFHPKNFGLELGVYLDLPTKENHHSKHIV